MKIGFSELVLLGQDVEKNIELLLAAGSDSIELFMDASGYDEDINSLSELAIRLRGYKIPFTVHPAAWDVNLTAQNKAVRDAAFEQHMRAIEFAAAIGAEQVVVHPGVCSFNKEVARMRAHEIIVRLADFAKIKNIRLAVENVGKKDSLYTEESFCHVLDDIDPVVGYLIDVGHAHMNGWNVPALIRRLSGRLLGLHIHDNWGAQDEHLPIYSGNTDWEQIWSAIKENCTEQTEIILEYAVNTPLRHLTEGKRIIIEQLSK